jgi:hypothetical protein
LITAFKAFYEYEGIEVAQNQSPEDLEMLYYGEIHLRTLKHNTRTS